MIFFLLTYHDTKCLDFSFWKQALFLHALSILSKNASCYLCNSAIQGSFVVAFTYSQIAYIHRFAVLCVHDSMFVCYKMVSIALFELSAERGARCGHPTSKRHHHRQFPTSLDRVRNLGSFAFCPSRLIYFTPASPQKGDAATHPVVPCTSRDSLSRVPYKFLWLPESLRVLPSSDQP